MSIMLTVSLITGVIYVKKVIRINMQDAAQKSNEIVADKLEQIYLNVEQATDMVISSDTMQKKFNQDNRIDQMRERYMLTCLVNNLIKNNQNTDIAILYHRTGNIITSNSIKLSDSDIKKLDEKLIDPGIVSGWVRMSNRGYCVLSIEKNAISYYKKVTSIYTGEVIGIISVDVPEEQIHSCYAEDENENVEVFILDEDGIIISATDKSLIYGTMEQCGTYRKDGTFQKNNGENYYVTQTEKMQNGCKVLRLVKEEGFMQTAIPEIRIILGSIPKIV